MKKIKPIALKEASLLSNEEMKNLFGGSAVDPLKLVDAVCNDTTTACKVVAENGSGIKGHCGGSATYDAVSCYCEYTSGTEIVRVSDSQCYKVLV